MNPARRMKLSNLRPLGRYINPETGRPVNIHKGTCSGGWSRYFWTFRGKRNFVGEEFRKWERVQP